MGGYGVDGRGTPTGDDGWGGGGGDALSYGCVVARRARDIAPRRGARRGRNRARMGQLTRIDGKRGFGVTVSRAMTDEKRWV